jgi:glycopeptide antibiotics resistance protein
MGWFAQWHKKNHYYRLALGLISMGIALEFIQAQTGYRFLEIADIFANSLGIFLAWVVLSYTACARILLYLETRL